MICAINFRVVTKMKRTLTTKVLGFSRSGSLQSVPINARVIYFTKCQPNIFEKLLLNGDRGQTTFQKPRRSSGINSSFLGRTTSRNRLKSYMLCCREINKAMLNKKPLSDRPYSSGIHNKISVQEMLSKELGCECSPSLSYNSTHKFRPGTHPSHVSFGAWNRSMNVSSTLLNQSYPDNCYGLVV